ncbi:MAG TPA: hypothetical protein VFQ53_22760 [Kofleriaceae bacterium]|nr:hypothetical protein [Kofleriaceae bacterium]
MTASDPVVEHHADFAAAREQLLHPPRFQNKTLWLVGSVLLFVLATSGGRESWIDIAMLVGVILAHELGHAIAMLLVGYRDVRIFFLPFFGGAAAGRRTGVATWKEAVVLLAGPIPGIVAGCVLAFVVGPDVRTLVLMLVGVNALNLLPVFPLDGGQLFQVLVFSRHRTLELVFLWIAGALGVVAAVMLRSWMFGLIAVSVLFGMSHRKRILDAAHALRDARLPADPAQLDDTQLRALHDAMWSSLPPPWQAQWRGKPRLQAEAMQQILDRTRRPPSAGATTALLLVWFAGLALAFVGAIAAVPVDKPTRAEIARSHGAIAGFTLDMTRDQATTTCRKMGGVAVELSGGALACEGPHTPDVGPVVRIELRAWDAQPSATIVWIGDHAVIQHGIAAERGAPEERSRAGQCGLHAKYAAECAHIDDAYVRWTQRLPGGALATLDLLHGKTALDPTYLVFTISNLP